MDEYGIPVYASKCHNIQDKFHASLCECGGCELESLKLQNEKYRKALGFYAQISNLDKPAYERQGVLVRNLRQSAYVDGGKRAREALSSN